MALNVSQTTHTYDSDGATLIFERIRQLCVRPTPPLLPINDLQLIFADIQVLCELPQPLSPINDDINDQTIESSDSNEITSTNSRPKKRITSKCYYQNCGGTENVPNVFVNLIQSKLFCSLVRGRDANVIQTNANCDNEVNKKKRRNVSKKVATNNSRNITLNRRDKCLSIDCDFTAKIKAYSEQFDRQSKKVKTKTNSSCKSLSNSDNTNADRVSNTIKAFDASSDISMRSQATSHSPCDLPITPISSLKSFSSSSSLSQLSTISTQSILSRIGIANASKIRIESYRDYYKENTSARHHKLLKQKSIDYKQKVLEWKQNRLESGSATPTRNIECLETPPGSPIAALPDRDSFDSELSLFIQNIQNENFSSDRTEDEFNSLMNELYS